MSLQSRRDVFQAIADPTRRQIIHLLAGEAMNLNAIAGNFKMSRPAISQHIKILAQCGMIIIRQQGRERFCEAKWSTLTEVSDWVNQYRAFWTSKFDALDIYLEKVQSKKASRKKITHKSKKKST